MTDRKDTDANRRQLLTMTLGGAVLAAVASTPAQAAKVSKSSVRYQDSPKGGKDCKGCKLFQPPNACKTVDGAISPNGWCALWIKA